MKEKEGNFMMTILYEVGNKLYLNITNRCPCSCTFCIRNNGDGAYGSDSLWLEREPTVQEVIEQLEKTDLNKYAQVVFCGYGEPLERINDVAEICRYLRTRKTCPPIRINTNGLSDLINEKPTAEILIGLVDIMSISLNAGSSKEYQIVSQPTFGEKSYRALLHFAQDCKEIFPKVMFTVVDVIPPEEIELARRVAEDMGIEFRVRKYDA